MTNNGGWIDLGLWSGLIALLWWTLRDAKERGWGPTPDEYD